MSGAIEFSDAPSVSCPYKDDKYSCDMKLLEREIKAVSKIKKLLFTFETYTKYRQLVNIIIISEI